MRPRCPYCQSSALVLHCQHQACSWLTCFDCGAIGRPGLWYRRDGRSIEDTYHLSADP